MLKGPETLAESWCVCKQYESTDFSMLENKPHESKWVNRNKFARVSWELALFGVPESLLHARLDVGNAADMFCGMST